MAKEDRKEEKLKALDAALGQIEKQYGKGAVMKLSLIHIWTPPAA